MLKALKYGLFYLGACTTILVSTSGCASGGFKLTRQYAHFVNSNNIILRIVLYILTGIVFAATILIDMVVFNTMDFWEGKVSAGDYKFNQGDKTFYVHHEFIKGTDLKRSTIVVRDHTQKQLQEVLITELPTHEVEMYVDGKLQAHVNSSSQLQASAI